MIFPLIILLWGVFLMIQSLREEDETKAQFLYIQGLCFMILSRQ